MNIFVGNISFKSEENALEELFARYGEVNSVKIIKDMDTGRSKGFGFIVMEDSEAQNAIKELNGTFLDGKNLVVNEARPRTTPSSGGYNNGNGNYRGGYNR